MHDKTKLVTGISQANCSTCAHRGSNDDGNFPEFNVSWPCCDIYPQYENLKSFPFKKEMRCWVPNFWHSKFTNLIKHGNANEENLAYDAFLDAINS